MLPEITQQEEATLDVYGRGVSSTKPDYFSVHFEVCTEDPDDEYCYKHTAEFADEVMRAIKTWTRKTDLIRTTSFEYSHYTYTEKNGTWPRGKIIAQVSTTIYVESGRINEIASLLNTVRKAGVTRISDVTFSLSDSLRKKEREKALRLAAEAALSDARTTAKAFGVSVLGLSRIDIDSGFTHDSYSDRYIVDEESDCCVTMDKCDGYDNLPKDFINTGEVRTCVTIQAWFRLNSYLHELECMCNP